MNELKEIRLNGSEKMVSFMENYIIFVILYRSMRLNDASFKVPKPHHAILSLDPSEGKTVRTFLLSRRY